jgi:hypothetical protein
VEPPKREKFTSEEVSTLGDVRALVSQVSFMRYMNKTIRDRIQHGCGTFNYHTERFIKPQLW